MTTDDPRITAYALGELDDDERREVERWLEEHPEAREEVEQIQAMAGLLEEELGEERESGLGEERMAAVLRQAEGDEDREEPETKKKRRSWILRPAVALAATVLLVVGVGIFWVHDSSPLVPFVYPLGYESADLLPSFLKKGESKEDLPQEQEQGPTASVTIATTPPATTVVMDGKNKIVGGDMNLHGWQEAKRRRNASTGEQYDRASESPFLLVARAPLSTFSVDVDTASYANVRRFLTRNTLPPAGAVRTEELINYFTYDYPAPTGPHPFSVNVEIGPAPWQPKHRLVRVGLRGKPVQKKRRPPSNLVFLIDVSGSMSDLNKLPLLRQGMKLLVDQLTENDRVALVVYAGASGLVLPSTACTHKNRPKILSALERLQAGGSTNGGAGIELAYQTAVAHFIKGGVNRVLLATDGDFNVGISSRGALVKLIKQKSKSGVFLSVLGFGMGNLKDATLEQLTNKGNGNYAYIDTINEARKVLVEQMTGTLITIAKDVKIQVEFNPARAQAYRLIGYENRRLANKDFANDKKDAGEIGADHRVTALYEVVPPGVKLPAAARLKYQKPTAIKGTASKELLTVRLRYKAPAGTRSTLLSVAATDAGAALEQTSADFKLAAAVAWFGMTLRGSTHAGQKPHQVITGLIRPSLGRDRNGRRAELMKLVKKAADLSKRR